MVVIDTDIFITALRGNAESAKHLSTLKGKAAVSIITELELFVGAKAKLQKQQVETILEPFDKLKINNDIYLLAKRLLKEFFDGTPLQHQLVAAYLVGMAVEPDCFNFIPVCKTPDETGCICSWRTFKEDYEPLYVQQEKFKAIVTNPLTWSTDAPEAPSADNKGGVLLNFNKIIPNIVNASIHDGVLWVSKPKFLGNIFYTNKNYHIADYNLFYINVRNNAKERIACFQNIASNESR